MAEPIYRQLSKELVQQIEADKKAGNAQSPYAFPNEGAVRRKTYTQQNALWRTPFVRDTDAILNSVYYNRYADKTQVFSLYKNDDITRRALHVQLVSRIARSIGGVLGLNCDLIEAIALGHDLGHTPFGHAGETYLNELYHAETGRFFKHNLHSVRVLDGMIPYNLTLQTLDGILCHDGEFELDQYRPQQRTSFAALDALVEQAYLERDLYKKMVPGTLEGCLVRICDIIAYLGKDRQDAERAALAIPNHKFAGGVLGSINAEIIHNLTVEIIENSYGKPYIKLGEACYDALQTIKQENYKYIYGDKRLADTYENIIQPMFAQIYYRLLTDLKKKNRESIIFKHHVDFVNKSAVHSYQRQTPYEQEEPNQILVDYIASMTDDYFVELHAHLFPNSPLQIKYVSYFEGI